MRNSICIYLIASLQLFASSSLAQTRVIFNNDAYMVIGNNTYVVLDNGNINAITEAGTGGRIITEAETNRIRWNISNNSGTYTVPFYDDDNAQEIPFSLTITAPGTAGATNSIDFSTYDNTSWDNSVYMPSGVTNMSSAIGGPNNSSKVIDRFWIINANGYATKPTVTLSFTYIDNEFSTAGNIITEGNLKAQRWSNTLSNWDSYIPQGNWSDAGTRGTVTSVPVVPADFFRVWTLVDNSFPLPVELVKFQGKCESADVILTWSTASETNNDFFTLEKSLNGIDFQELAIIDAAGNSSATTNYSYTDVNSFAEGAYYRLKQTDYNGQSETFPAIYVPSCNDQDATIDVFNQAENDFTLFIASSIENSYTITVYNALGQTVLNKEIYVSAGINTFNFLLENMDDAMYFVNVSDGRKHSFSKKIIINQ
jgi:hypothetical protein